MEQISKKFMNWASILEDSTREQVEMTSRMPFIHPHIALMPDAHLGKGCAVGAVLPTVGAIMPAAVGVDIGCGMIAVRTQFHLSDLPEDRRPLREAIEAAVPLSAGKYNERIYADHTERRVYDLEMEAVHKDVDPDRFAANWRLQLGTLGSGNHFIEVSLDEDDRVWLFLHSGSRGVGNKMATHFIKIAQKQCERRFTDLPHQDLAYLVQGDREFTDYINHLRWSQRFALLNREEMMDRVVGCFEEWMYGDVVETVEGDVGVPAKVERTLQVNCHHNYTEREHHFGKDVWLSRKGAISAKAGEWGLIPGSMGTRSYVVQGKGNRLALESSPHGAGREYGRRAASKTFTYDQLVESMQGIEWSRSGAFLDEIPQAYKDIDQVMADAADLVEVRHTLRQIVNVKGD